MIWHGMDCEWMINLIVLQMASEKLKLGPISNQPLCIYIYTQSQKVFGAVGMMFFGPKQDKYQNSIRLT